jgi:hypothetical protein
MKRFTYYAGFIIFFVLFVPVCPYMYEKHAWGQRIVVSKSLQNSNVPVNHGYNRRQAVTGLPFLL